MTTEPAQTAPISRIGIRTLAAGAGDVTGDPALALDRYLIDSRDAGGSLALVEHTLAPRVLAAPVHLHTREDEYSYVLEGSLGVFQDDAEVVVGPGELVFKPRSHWHTFWNAGDSQLRVLELIVPGGIEQLFRLLAEPGGEYDPDSLPALAAEYGCEVDFDRTMPLVERHGLAM